MRGIRAKRVNEIRSAAGFTLIELLVVVVIIGILAAIALPNFIGAQDKAREASVKGNMRTAQMGAEVYSTDHAGTYPQTIDALKPYYPGGSSSDGGTVGNAPVNPFNSAPEWPTLGSVANVQTARSTNPTTVTIGSPGQIEYSPVGTTAYAVRGAGKDGKALGGTSANTTLVLSNQ
jgi:prepilin-type N-terminal cleavage/methylation domain-containing protein